VRELNSSTMNPPSLQVCHMAAANFDDCYTQICGLFNLEPELVEPDKNGKRGFTVTYRDADISFLERATAEAPSVSMLVKFGIPPADKTAEILSALMGASFLMLDQDGPTFMQEPDTGDIFLHRVMSLEKLHVPALPTLFDQLADQVARWSRGYFLDDNNPVSPGTLTVGRFGPHPSADRYQP
jgi:hypothetical protein